MTKIQYNRIFIKNKHFIYEYNDKRCDATYRSVFYGKECIPPNKEEVQDMFPNLKVSKCDCCTFSIESNETEIAVHVDFKKNRMIKIAVFPEDLKKKSVVIPTEVVDSHDFFLELVEDIRTCVFLGIDKTTYIKNWK